MTGNRELISLSFLFGIASILFVWFGEENSVYQLTREDGIVEYLSASFYLIGFIVSFIAIFKSHRILLPIAWAVLCFVFLGEETSWFQRILGYSVPEVESVSTQNEFNLHNLHIFQGSASNDSFIESSQLFLPQNIFRLGFFGYFLVIPLLLYIPAFKRLMSKIGYKKPAASFILVILFVFPLTFILALYSPVEPIDLKNSLAETREMLYAFFIMMYIIIYIKPDKKNQPAMDLP